MELRESVEEAFRSIRAAKLRAALTMLGIVIGVAAVITMVALGRGAQRAVDQRIAALGARQLSVYPGQRWHAGVASAGGAPLRAADAHALARDSTLLAGVVPEMVGSFQVEYGNQNLNVSVVGSTPNYAAVKGQRVKHGRMFDAREEEARRRYAVLGSEIPEILGVNAAAMVRQPLWIGGVPFEILGVFDEKGSQGSWANPDERIVIPLQTAQHRVFGGDRLLSIQIEVAPGVPLEQGMVEVERILRRQHRIPPGAANDFRIRNRQALLETQQEASELFGVLLASIAGVSLVVGGIGIMNIMLVSVTERTREIGIRKALGATPTDVLMQFLVEALVICLLGGVLGIAIGGAVSLVLSKLAGWNTLLSGDAVALAFGVSAAVGLLFGLWPARRAALLRPIDALRYE